MTDRHLPKIILASGSPQRQALLRKAGYHFEVLPPGPDAEADLPSVGKAEELVAQMALRKAHDVADQLASGKQGDGMAASPLLLVACDTLAECQGERLGKPRDDADARRMLELLSGHDHEVHSGLCLWPWPRGEPVVRAAMSRLHMDALSPQQIDEYLASGQWMGKAGAFGYQDRVGWLHLVEGSESNVIGLPLELLAQMVGELDISRE